MPLRSRGTLTRTVVAVAVGSALWTAPSRMRPSDILGPASCTFEKTTKYRRERKTKHTLNILRQQKYKQRTIPETKPNQPTKNPISARGSLYFGDILLSRDYKNSTS